MRVGLDVRRQQPNVALELVGLAATVAHVVDTQRLQVPGAARVGVPVVLVRGADARGANGRPQQSHVPVRKRLRPLLDGVHVIGELCFVKALVDDELHIGVQQQGVLGQVLRRAQRHATVVSKVHKRVLDDATRDACALKVCVDALYRVVGAPRVADTVGVEDGRDRRQLPFDDARLVLDNHIEAQRRRARRCERRGRNDAVAVGEAVRRQVERGRVGCRPVVTWGPHEDRADILEAHRHQGFAVVKGDEAARVLDACHRRRARRAQMLRVDTGEGVGVVVVGRPVASDDIVEYRMLTHVVHVHLVGQPPPATVGVRHERRAPSDIGDLAVVQCGAAICYPRHRPRAVVDREATQALVRVQEVLVPSAVTSPMGTQFFS